MRAVESHPPEPRGHHPHDRRDAGEDRLGIAAHLGDFGTRDGLPTPAAAAIRLVLQVVGQDRSVGVVGRQERRLRAPQVHPLFPQAQIEGLIAVGEVAPIAGEAHHHPNPLRFGVRQIAARAGGREGAQGPVVP